jgi:multidrug efflux pump subunit AcrA (membrane-fusion protein)
LAAGVIVVILGTAGAVWAMNRSAAKPAAATNSLIAASTQTLQQTITTSGTFKPTTEADLSFAVPGTVTSLSAAVGTKVARGAVLAKVDSADLQETVASAQASLDAANAQVIAATGSSDTQVASAKAQVASAQSKLTATKQSLADATLTSPIAGTVASVSIVSGDHVSGGSSGAGGSSGGGSYSGTAGSGTSGGSSGTGANASGAGGSVASSGSASGSPTAQIVVISTSSWVLNASVGSADLAQIRKGLQAEITPTDTTTKVFGLVGSVGIVASSTSVSATFPVIIPITGSPTGLYSGGTANVSIIVKQIQSALTVPTTAVHTVNGKTVVYQQASGKQINTEVKVGGVYGPNTQILSGIKEGDKVVIESFRPGGGTGNRQRTGTGGGGGNNSGGAGFGGGGGTSGGGGFGGGGGSGGFSGRGTGGGGGN